MPRVFPMDRLNHRVFLSGVALALVLGVAGPASAARIRHNAVLKPPPTTNLSFSAFLAAGPSLWSHVNPRIPHGTRLAQNADGTVADTPFLEFLLFRRSLNPTRFDHYHPNVAPILASYLPPLPAVTPPTPAPQTVIPAPPPITPPANQTVPEPSTWFMGVVMAAGATYARTRARRRAMA